MSKEEMIEERYLLVTQRIREIAGEDSVREPFRDYFIKTADFIGMSTELFQKIEKGWLKSASKEELKEWNNKLYRDILPGHYQESYGNPAYAVSVLGEDYGQMLSFLYTEIRGMIVYAFEQRKWDVTVLAELFAEIYHMFQDEVPETSCLK